MYKDLQNQLIRIFASSNQLISQGEVIKLILFSLFPPPLFYIREEKSSNEMKLDAPNRPLSDLTLLSIFSFLYCMCIPISPCSPPPTLLPPNKAPRPMPLFLLFLVTL